MSETVTSGRGGELDGATVNQATGSADYKPDGIKISVAMGTVLLSVIIDTTNKKHNQEISGARSTSSRTDCKGKCITPEEHTAMFFYHYFSSAS